MERNNENMKKILEVGKKALAMRNAGYTVEEISKTFDIPESNYEDMKKAIDEYEKFESVKHKHSKGET